MKSEIAYKTNPSITEVVAISTYTKTENRGAERERVRERNMGGWAIAVHGGAGVDPNLPLQRQEEAKQLLTRCLNLGISALGSNVSAIDVVELVVYFSTSTSYSVSHMMFFSIPLGFMRLPLLFDNEHLFLWDNNCVATLYTPFMHFILSLKKK